MTTLCLITQRKWKMWIQKIYKVSVKIKIKTSSNEELISEMQWKFPYIYILYIKANMVSVFDEWITFLDDGGEGGSLYLNECSCCLRPCRNKDRHHNTRQCNE